MSCPIKLLLAKIDGLHLTMYLIRRRCKFKFMRNVLNNWLLDVVLAYGQIGSGKTHTMGTGAN